MRFIRKVVLYTLCVLCVFFTACERFEVQTGKYSGQQATRLKILTTIPPLYSFASNICGEHADVENLLPSGAGPHEYAFSPQDMILLSGADVIIKNGAGLENWLDDAIISTGREGLVVVDASHGVEIHRNDPHIWLSPRRAIIQVENIKNVLIKADPEREAVYEKNAAKYIERLEHLDEYIMEEITSWRKKEFVSFHSAFLYFTIDYGLRQVAVIQESPDQEPSPGHLKNVIDSIRARGITTIFTEPQASHKIVHTLARDLDLRVLALDTLETGELYPRWYEEKMRENLDVLKEALQ